MNIEMTHAHGGECFCVFCVAEQVGNSDCAWCGGECFSVFPNRSGELFCSRWHRVSSNAARDRFIESHPLCKLDDCNESGELRSSGEVFCDQHAWIAEEGDP